MKKYTKLIFTALLSTGFLAGCGGTTGGDVTDDPIVVESPIDHIAVTTLPTKVIYDELDMFDSTGMVVTGYRQDGTEKVLEASDYIVRPSGPLTSSTNSITIVDRNYGTTCDFSVTVNEGAEITVDPSLWLEAEKGTIVTATGGTMKCIDAFYSLANASGAAVLKNFGRIGNSLTLKVNASATGRVKLVVKICKRPNYDVNFEDMYSVKVNDIAYPVTGALVAGPSGNYFDLTSFESYIKVNEGLNTFVVEALNDTGANLDAFGFASDTVTFTDGGAEASLTHHDEGAYVTKAPTTTSTGEYTDGCKDCGFGSTGKHELPMLNDKDYEVNNGIYSITVSGKTFSFGSKVYRFECEDMTAAGTIAGSASHKGEAIEDYPTEIIGSSEYASNGKAVNNFGSEGNTLTLVITSTKAETAVLEVCIGARVSSNKGYTVAFNGMVNVSFNDKDITTDANVVPINGNGKAISSYGYYEFHTISLGDIDLVEGENTIVITVVKDGDGKIKTGNLDYISLTTKEANLEVKAAE